MIRWDLLMSSIISRGRGGDITHGMIFFNDEFDPDEIL